MTCSGQHCAKGEWSTSGAAEAHKAEAQRWLRIACEDLAVAEAPGNAVPLTARHRYMLAQQAAEKGLKAALIFLGIDPPRSHNLVLLADLLPDDWDVRSVHADLARLTIWIVESRYPGDWPDATDDDATAAASDARAVLDAVLADIQRMTGSR